MRMTLLVHVLGGGLGLVSGYLAIYATKGATLHRKTGTLFVWAMLTMAVTGLLISAVEGVAPAINVPSALLTFYLVITSLATVRPAPAPRWFDRAAMLMAPAIGAACFVLAIDAMAQGGAEAGLAFPLVLFGGVALLAAEGDRRTMRAGGLRGTPRLKRHLWRMCFALFIASIAFYLGPDRIPEAMRSPAIRGLGVLLPIFAMSYWLWRLRAKRTARRAFGAVPEVA